MGDYYVWYCEWCDSKNLTLWTRVEKNDVLCGACHRGISVPGAVTVPTDINVSVAAVL
jgi:hypothetical protein